MRHIMKGIFWVYGLFFPGAKSGRAWAMRTQNMQGSTRLSGLLLMICAVTLVSCATTRVTDVWKDEAYKGKVQKTIVIMVAKTPEMRDLFEGRFVAELRARGNSAIQSYKIVPFEQLPEKELVKSRIKSAGADSVLVSRLVGSKTVQAYMPGKMHTVPGAYYGWGTYYEIVFVDYGYTDDMELSYIETNLYDIATEKLIWSAQSKTERTEGQQQLVNTFIDVILKKLSSDKIIQ